MSTRNFVKDSPAGISAASTALLIRMPASRSGQIGSAADILRRSPRGVGTALSAFATLASGGSTDRRRSVTNQDVRRHGSGQGRWSRRIRDPRRATVDRSPSVKAYFVKYHYKDGALMIGSEHDIA
jgi:hypothetical protein